jgi:WD40 repeat protein/uncharacterized caspase-like protein
MFAEDSDMKTTSSPSKYVVAAAVFAVLACAQDNPAGQNPVLVPQAGGTASTTRAAFGAANAWIAVADANARVRIFDVATGRLSHAISISTATNSYAPPPMSAHPTKNVLTGVDADGVLATYDVITGAVVWKAPTGLTCSAVQFSPDGSRIYGSCTPKNSAPGKMPPGVIKVWDSENGRELGSMSAPEGVYGVQISADAGLCSGMKMPSTGKAVLRSLGRRSASDPDMFRTIVFECQTGRSVAEVRGYVIAISSKYNRALSADVGGAAAAFFVTDLKSGNRTPIPADKTLGFVAGISPDGSVVATPTASGMLTVDMRTAEVRTLPADNLPFPYGSALSRDNDHVALVQGDSVLIVRLSTLNERRLLGNKDAHLISVAEMLRMADLESTRHLPSPGEQQEQNKTGSRLRDLLGGGGAGRKEDIQAQREHAEKQERERAAAMEAAQAEALEKMSKFGSVSGAPAAAAYLQNGRFLAVLAADVWWTVWDTATGNRLPFRKRMRDPMKLQLTPESLLQPREIAELETMLAGGVHQTTRPPEGGEVACESDGGRYAVRVTRAGGKLVSAEVVSRADASRVDLLATGLNFAALAPAADSLYTGRPTPQCSLSRDGSRLVVEVPIPGKSSDRGKLAKIFRPKMEDFLGKQTADSLAVYDLKAGRELCRLEAEPGKASFDITAGQLQFRPDGDRIVAGSGTEGIFAKPVSGLRMWDAATGKRLLPTVQSPGKVLGFSPDGSEYYTTVSAANTPVAGPLGHGIRSWSVQTGEAIAEFPEVIASTQMLLLNTTRDVLMGSDRDGGLSFFDRKTGKLLGTLRAMQEGEWLVTTPSGYFDGSPRGWSRLAWKTSGGTLETSPGEIFFNEFYRPGLLADLLRGRVPDPPRTISQIDRRQPSVSIATDTNTTAARSAQVKLVIREAPAGGGHATGSGVRDVRLFRNGSLVKAWRGGLTLNGVEATLQAEVPLLSGENRIVAYAFNRDNVRSQDAAVIVQSTAESRPGTVYIIAIGVNEYANREFNLKYAVPDANRMSEMLAKNQQELGRYKQVITAALLDREATRANIMLALSILGGREKGQLPAGAPAALSALRAVNPEDAVVVFFAGHGTAAGDRFYILPHDLGYSGPRQSLQNSIETVLGHSISDQDLERAFEPIDAAQLMLIIDACNSGKALDAEEQRRGPMNSRGLAQLAYEKGIYILTAAQAYQAALESSRLGHGYLTFALAEEGLRTPAPDVQPKDGSISAIEWFDYATHRVPQLQMQALADAEKAGRLLTFDAEPDSKRSPVLQVPRAYYRRDNSSPVLVVGGTAPQ